VVSYIGLVPSTFDTGPIQRHGHITNHASHVTASCERCCMPVGPRPGCEAAYQAARQHRPLNPYWVRVCSRQGYKRAVVAVAQRLARILFQMWRKGEDFDVTKLNVISERRIHTRTYYWRIKKPQEQLVGA